MAPPNAPPDKLRVDKWLWHARFFKTRRNAAEVAASGRLRINGTRCAKPAEAVRPGDVLTFPQANGVRVVQVEAVGVRRGPAPEAALLYSDLAPTPDAAPKPSGPREAERPASGRPTKRDRRALERMRNLGSG